MKNTNKRVLLYDPYLETLGGGERHILSIIKVFDELGFGTDLLWSDVKIVGEIREKLGLGFQNLRVKRNFLRDDSFFLKLSQSAAYDYLFYVTDGSYFFSRAKRNFIFAMVPQKNLYESSVLNRLKLHNFHFIANSHFTQMWLTSWGVKSSVLYPFVNDVFLSKAVPQKSQTIVSVGRFFTHLHSKQQDRVITTFIKMKAIDKRFKDWKLILVGRLAQQDKPYFNKIKSQVKERTDIELQINVSEKELARIYEKSSTMWHFTGMGIDENKHPERVEHLGVAPLEAMASGGIPFCFANGGIVEIVRDGQTGFLFSSEQELFKKMVALVDNPQMVSSISTHAIDYIEREFSYPVFKHHVVNFFNL